MISEDAIDVLLSELDLSAILNGVPGANTFDSFIELDTVINDLTKRGLKFPNSPRDVEVVFFVNGINRANRIQFALGTAHFDIAQLPDDSKKHLLAYLSVLNVS